MTESQLPALFIIAGLSGAGKSTALRVFEDHRYFAVDGLPVSVAPDVATIMKDGAMQLFSGMAIGLDVRQDDFLFHFIRAMKQLEENGFKPQLIFLESETRTLINRYAASRRPHPLENGQMSLEEALAAEKALLGPLRKQAALVIDTTDLTLHDLRRRLQKLLSPNSGRKLQVIVLSFGFKHGIPQDADFVFDLRFLPNPYFVEKLKPLSGQNEEVASYVFASRVARDYVEHICELLSFAIQAMEKEGRYRLTIALGCTGGRHRSVAFAEYIGKKIKDLNYPLSVIHRDLAKK